MERDILENNPYDVTAHFNSHAHVERDIYCADDRHANRDFNSHAHVERDQVDIRKFRVKDISTHTLTWSVTFGSRLT